MMWRHQCQENNMVKRNPNTRSTRTDLEPKYTPPKLTPQQECEQRGGYWDAEKGVCVLIKKEEKPKALEVPPVTPKTPETFTDPRTGNLSGITLPDGRTFSGLSPDEVREIAERETARGVPPAGTAPVGTAQAQAEEQARLQAEVGQIGQTGQLTEAKQAKVNLSQAATAGAAGAIPGILGGAIGGATIGALGGPIGAVGGAIIGGLGTFVSGVLSNIKEQQRGELQAADVELKNARTNMRQLAMLASQDPVRADIYIQQYNQQLTRVIQARRQTKAEVQGDLNSWMEDGREQLADFDSFLQPGGIADIYGQKLAVSLQTGVPLTEADLLSEFDI